MANLRKKAILLTIKSILKLMFLSPVDWLIVLCVTEVQVESAPGFGGMRRPLPDV